MSLYRPLMTRPIMSPLMRLTPTERLLLAAIIHHSATNVIAIFLLSELFNLFLIDVDSKEKISLGACPCKSRCSILMKKRIGWRRSHGMAIVSYDLNYNTDLRPVRLAAQGRGRSRRGGGGVEGGGGAGACVAPRPPR